MGLNCLSCANVPLRNYSLAHCRQKFFSQVVIDAWNQLPENVIAADSVESLKKRRDEHMITRDEQ